MPPGGGGGESRWVVGGRPGACEIELEIKIKTLQSSKLISANVFISKNCLTAVVHATRKYN